MQPALSPSCQMDGVSFPALWINVYLYWHRCSITPGEGGTRPSRASSPAAIHHPCFVASQVAGPVHHKLRNVGNGRRQQMILCKTLETVAGASDPQCPLFSPDSPFPHCLSQVRLLRFSYNAYVINSADSFCQTETISGSKFQRI